MGADGQGRRLSCLILFLAAAFQGATAQDVRTVQARGAAATNVPSGIVYTANWRDYQASSTKIKCFSGITALASNTLIQVRSQAVPAKATSGWASTADTSVADVTYKQPLASCGQNVTQTYPTKKAGICSAAGIFDFFDTDVDIKGVLPDTCVLRIASNNVASQVYVSGKRTSTIPDGYTSSIAEFNGIIDLRPWLRIGNNRISIATLSSKCTASPVDYTARLDCGTSSTARAAAAAAAAADAQCATAGTEAELGCPAPAFPTGAFPAGSTIQTCQCYCPPVTTTRTGTPTGAPTTSTARVTTTAPTAGDGAMPTDAPTPSAAGGPPTAAGTPTTGGSPTPIVAGTPTGPSAPTSTAPPTAADTPTSAGMPTAGTPSAAPPTVGDVPTAANMPTSAGTPTAGTPSAAPPTTADVPTGPGTPTSGSTPTAAPPTSQDTPTSQTPTVGSPTPATPTAGSPTPNNTPTSSNPPPTSGDTPTAGGSPTPATMPTSSNPPPTSGGSPTPASTPTAAPPTSAGNPPTSGGGGTPTAGGGGTPTAAPPTSAGNPPTSGGGGTPTAGGGGTPTAAPPTSAGNPPTSGGGGTPTAGGGGTPTAAGGGGGGGGGGATTCLTGSSGAISFTGFQASDSALFTSLLGSGKTGLLKTSGTASVIGSGSCHFSVDSLDLSGLPGTNGTSITLTPFSGSSGGQLTGAGTPFTASVGSTTTSVSLPSSFDNIAGFTIDSSGGGGSSDFAALLASFQTTSGANLAALLAELKTVNADNLNALLALFYLQRVCLFDLLACFATN